MNPGSAGECGLAAGVDGDAYAPHRLQQGSHVYADDARHGDVHVHALIRHGYVDGHAVR